MKRLIDLPGLKSLLFGGSAFDDCSHAVFESEWIEERMMNRLAQFEISCVW